MIIGVSGPICSGKDTFSKILAEKGFTIFSFGDILREEMVKKGIALERKNIQDYGNKLRNEEGGNAIAKRIIAKMDKDRNYVIQGFRNPSEVEDFMKLDDFILVALDSSKEKRYERIKERDREKDPKTFEDFMKLDRRELESIGEDKNGLRIGDCMKMAHLTIINENGFEELKEKVGKFLEEHRI